MKLGKNNLLKSKKIRYMNENGITTIIILYALFFLVGTIFVSYFYKPNYWLAALRTYLPVTIMSIGLGVVILGGASDLSCGSTSSFCAVIIIYTHTVFQWSAAMSFIAGILVGILCGAFKGFLVAYVRVAPLLATFAFSWFIEGLGWWLVPFPTDLPSSLDLSRFNNMKVFGIIPIQIVTVAVCLLIWLVIKNTSLGMNIKAMGSNFDNAYATGINCPRTRLFTYTFCGAMSGVAGIAISCLVCLAYYNYASPLNVQAIASCVLGGLSLGGGEGLIACGAFGAFFFGMMSQLVLSLVNSAYIQPLVNYGLMFLCIVLPAIIKKLRKKNR